MQKIVALSALTISFGVQSQSASSLSEDFPSHCQDGESAYLDAKMQKSSFSEAGVYKREPTGKVLSLCYKAEETGEAMMVYRYGKVGHVEFEKVATQEQPFNYYHFTMYPKASKINTDILFFSNGKFNYYVGQALGMGSGISITVFKQGKKIVELFSGNEPDLDYKAANFMDDTLPRELLIAKTPTDKEMRSPYRLEIIKRRYKEIYENKHTTQQKDTEKTGVATAYISEWGDEIERINTSFYGHLGETKYQIYYEDNEPFFILQQSYSYNAPASMTPERVAQLKQEEDTIYEAHDPAKTTLEEWRYYYDGNHVVRVLNPVKKVQMDLERANNVRHLVLEILTGFKAE